MVLVAVLVFLLLRQIMPVASALAGGIALSTFGTISRFVSWGLRHGVTVSGAAAALGARSLTAGDRSPTEQLRVERAGWGGA